MMDRRMMSGLVLLTVLLAGCTAQPDIKEDEVPGIGDPVGAETANVLLEFEDCHSTVMSAVLPAEWVAPYVPEGFTPRFYGPMHNWAVLHMLDCDRMLFNGTVRSDVRIFDVGVQGERDADPDVGSLFYVEVFTNDDLLRGLLTALGATVQKANITNQQETILTEVDRLGWVIDSDSCTFAFGFPQTGQGNEGWTDSGIVWFPGSPHVKLERSSSYTAAEVHERDGVLLEMSGGCDAKAMFGGSDRWGFTHQNRWDGRHTYNLTGGFTA